MEDKAPPHPPNRLLVTLLPYGMRALSEVGLTTTIWWLLGLEGGAGALDSLIRRKHIDPEPGGSWSTEVVGLGGRSDLEYRWGDPLLTQVIVEAKIGHYLHYTQLAGYRCRLPEDGGLLVVLVPGARRLEGNAVVAAYRAAHPDDPVTLDVWSFDDVAAALEAHLPDSSDVAQFRGMVEAAGALDIAPFEDAELLDDNPTRLDDIVTVFDYATYGLFDQWLPSRQGRSFQRDMREVPLDPYPKFVSVGVGLESTDPEPNPRPWVWLRVSSDPACSPTADAVLDRLRPDEVVRVDGTASVPLRLPTGTPGGEVIQVLRHEIEEIANAIRKALDELVEAFLAEVPQTVVVAPFENQDVIDAGTGPAEIESVVLEAAKSLRPGRVGRLQVDDSYAKNYHIRVEPFGTHVAVAFDRRAAVIGGETRPWAWLRVHGATPYAEIALGVLQELYPGQVVDDGVGLAVPIDLANVSGQLQMTLNAIRRAILDAHRGASV